MRLGDLDALREDFKSRLADCNEWIEKAKDKETKIRANAVKAFIGEVIMTIDNAPTVVKDYDEGFNAGYAEAIKNIPEYRKLADKLQRPQGEWKVYSRQGDIPITDYCSNCKYEMRWYRNKYNFCPNCGAEMRGK